jgi:hypothetical protein
VHVATLDSRGELGPLSVMSAAYASPHSSALTTCTVTVSRWGVENTDVPPRLVLLLLRLGQHRLWRRIRRRRIKQCSPLGALVVGVLDNG